MYHYIEDKDFLKKMKRLCGDIVNQLVQRINNDSVMEVNACLIGSGAKNLITQNAAESIDLDYNLCILRCSPSLNEDDIKDYVMEQFNVILKQHGWGNCQDSTSALTTKKWYFAKGNPTPFKIDLAIVRETPDGRQRLIHEKTGWVCYDRWYWNETRDSRGLQEKVHAIKQEELWPEVRERYLDKKNMYLRRQDQDHPSFVVYIETINEIYYQYFGERLDLGRRWYGENTKIWYAHSPAELFSSVRL